MGTRFNVLMTIQVPLKQQPQVRRKQQQPTFGVTAKSGGGASGFGGAIMKCALKKSAVEEEAWEEEEATFDESDGEGDWSISLGASMSAPSMQMAPRSALGARRISS